MSKYTAADLAHIKEMIAKGVTSIEVAGEKYNFRSLDEMQRIAAMIESEVNPAARRSSGFHLPTFSRG